LEFQLNKNQLTTKESVLKQLIILQVFFMLFSCSSRKELMMQQKPHEGAEPDSISNYFLFDYIYSLIVDIFMKN